MQTACTIPTEGEDGSGDNIFSLLVQNDRLMGIAEKLRSRSYQCFPRRFQYYVMSYSYFQCRPGFHIKLLCHVILAGSWLQCSWCGTLRCSRCAGQM